MPAEGVQNGLSVAGGGRRMKSGVAHAPVVARGSRQVKADMAGNRACPPQDRLYNAANAKY